MSSVTGVGKLVAASAVVFASIAVAAPKMPAPATANYARGTREADNASCIKCHSGIAKEHDSSLHARSFSEASFQKGYQQEPLAFCRGCHAPETAPAATPDAFAHGMACVTCHKPDTKGAVLSTRASGKAPHPVTAVADFGTRSCAGCHEFFFEHAGSFGVRGKMQKTMLEHGADTRSCASCHMAAGNGHSFRASRDIAFLQNALAVRAERNADGDAAFTLTARNVGHAFPTGDLFRRLVLRIQTTHGPVEYPFWRTFHAEGTTRVESTDNRLMPAQRQIVAARGPIDWEVAYQRVTGVQQSPPWRIDVEAELVLARGSLP